MIHVHLQVTTYESLGTKGKNAIKICSSFTGYINFQYKITKSSSS
uniref:Uncharacterized protein n=1 Tax=Arundo donax TaxID=35708 RepID=A0A0A9HEJ3_ARUDO